MKKLVVCALLIFLTSCSTSNNMRLADDQFLATYTDRSVGGDGTSVVKSVMRIAEKECGSKQVDIVKLNNTGIAVGTFPEATLIYKCK